MNIELQLCDSGGVFILFISGSLFLKALSTKCVKILCMETQHRLIRCEKVINFSNAIQTTNPTDGSEQKQVL